ncbi:MAG: hypothetical protein KDM81_19570 [Verrucomicrobiae bacterium]|nr:hypothetical protein [Verrucomicrobiae bacterium]
MTASVPSKRRRWLRTGLLLLGVLLLLSSLIMTVGWFWWMKPFRNLGDPEWLERHTALAQWEETQTRWLMANPPPLYEGMYYPFLASPRLARKVNIAMTATALLGLGCLFWGRRLSHKQ